MPSKGEAAVLLSVAKKETLNERGDEALDAAKKSLDAFTTIADQVGIWDASLAVTSAHILCDQPDDALRQCDALSKSATDLKGRASVALLKARALLAKGSGTLASDAAAESLKLAEEADDQQAVGKAFLLAAQIRLQLGQSKSALQSAEKAVSLFNSMDDDAGEAAAWLTVMASRFAAGAYEGGVAASFAALSLYGELGEQSGEARVLLKLADAQLKRKMFGEALPSAIKALVHFQKCGGSKTEVLALEVAVKAYIGLGQTLEASQVAKASVSTLRRLGKRRLEGLAMLSLARAHAADNWASEASEVVNSAISTFVQLGDRLAHGTALQLLAEINLSSGQLDDALQAGESAVKIFKEVGHPDHEIQASQVVLTINGAIEKNPALQSEIARKKEVQREIDLLLLNEVASALTQRNADEFKDKYEKLDKCQTLSAEDISNVITPAIQVDYDSNQEWISSTLYGSSQRHICHPSSWSYMLSRYGGMHYGPNFRLCSQFGHTMPLDEMHYKYAVLQLHIENRDGDWEEVIGFHPPIYDCGLQAQMASSLTLHFMSEAENAKAGQIEQ